MVRSLRVRRNAPHRGTRVTGESRRLSGGSDTGDKLLYTPRKN